MTVYARIQSGTVAELFTPPAGVPIGACFAPGLVWVDTGTSGAVPGWTFDGAAFHAPVAAPAPPPPSQISPLLFIGRFTDAEQTAIASAAMGNAALFLWFNKTTAAQIIDLADAQTAVGLDALVAAGLLTGARKIAILTP